MSFSVTILGSSSAKPTLSRHPSAQVVNVHEQYYLVDAGEGVQQQLIRYGINPLRLRAVFISHLHGDHVFGLFPLISTLALYGRKTPLRVFAPAPMGEILACHLKYFDSELPYPVVWTEVDTTKHALLMENRTLEVWSIPLRHRVPTAGFLFREKEPALNVDKFKITKYGLSVAQITAAKRGEDVTLSTGEVIPNGELTYRPYAPRSYAYLSDTNFSAKAAALAAGADLMYHEATYAAAEQKAAAEEAKRQQKAAKAEQKRQEEARREPEAQQKPSKTDKNQNKDNNNSNKNDQQKPSKEEPKKEPTKEPEKQPEQKPEEPKPSKPSVSGAAVANYAMKFIGGKYVWGGANLATGVDCSGFVMCVYQHFGYSLPHYSESLAGCGRGVSYANAQPGDIICYRGHCGIYIGGGMMVNALGAKYGIVVNQVNTSRLTAVRRIV